MAKSETSIPARESIVMTLVNPLLLPRHCQHRARGSRTDRQDAFLGRISFWRGLFLILFGLGSSGCLQEAGPVLAAARPDSRPVKVEAASADEADPNTGSASGSRLLAEAPPARSDDLSPAPESSGGLIGGLRNLIQSTDILGSDEDVSGGLLNQLDQAAGQLNRVRQSNRDAIRQANRQPRVGRNSASPNLVLIQLERMPFLNPRDIPADRSSHYRRLISESLFFTQHYAASADLTMARWSLLMGKNPALDRSNSLPAELGDQSLPALLWDGGYSTALIGQWDDPALPTDRGFDEWAGFRNRKESAPFPVTVSIDSTTMQLTGNSNGKQKMHAIDLFAEEAVHFLERHRAGRRPFFLMVSLPAFDPATDSCLSGETGERVDRALGTVMKALQELNLRSSTCVVLTATTGTAVPGDLQSPVELASGARSFPHGLGEGNLHIPLCVSWPGQIVPGETEHLSAAWDLLPTLVEITRTQRRPTGLPGLSFVPLMRGQAQPEHPLLYWSTPGQAAQAVRQGNWKGLSVRQSSGVQLYQLHTDPGETTNVAAQHPDVVKAMIARQ